MEVQKIVTRVNFQQANKHCIQNFGIYMDPFFLLLFFPPIIFFSTFADNCRSHISSRRCYRHGGQVRDILFCSFYC